jgi:TonB family protein
MVTTKGKPYERFGSYLLFKKLETDRLGELWRAGEISGEAISSTAVIRRFTAGDRQAILESFDHARAVASAVSGTTFVRNQKMESVDGEPFIAFEYTGGRSLRHIVEKGRGPVGATSGSPMPIDQALSIVEKLALSLETLNNMKYQGNRLTHGALIPHFVWISEEGEVRTAGQQLGSALHRSLSDNEVAREVAPFLAPEVRKSGEMTRAGDVYSLGALLYYILVGQEPPLADAHASIVFAKLLHRNEPVPPEIAAILVKALASEPAERYPSATEMRQALDKLLTGGTYAPTTFNLAFYLHNLLKKELEAETLDREKEAKVAVGPYVHAPARAAAAATAAPVDNSYVSPAPFASMAAAETPKKSMAPLAIAAAAILVVGGGAGAFFMMKSKGAPAATTAPVTASAVSPIPAPAAAPIEPIVVAVPPVDSAATATSTAAVPADEESRKKALEEAINKKLQEEMMKLQKQYEAELQKKGTTTAAPVKTAAVSAPAETPRTQPSRPAQAPETNAPSAAQLDAARRPETEQAAAAVVPPPVVQPVAPQIREGDLVEYGNLDTTPELRSPVRPTYPPMAMARKVEGSVIVSALITEEGRVADVRILRGETTRVGFDDAAIRAVKNASFSPPMKGGKRVKTWKPLPIVFKLQ